MYDVAKPLHSSGYQQDKLNPRSKAHRLYGKALGGLTVHLNSRDRMMRPHWHHGDTE